MNLSQSNRLIANNRDPKLNSLLLSCGLICASVFVGSFLCYIAFAIQLYRLFKYSNSNLLFDIIFLLNFSNIFKTYSGMSFHFVLIIVSVVYNIAKRIGKKHFKIDGFFATTVFLLLYMLFRCNFSIKNFIFIVIGVSFVLLFLDEILPENSVYFAKMMCFSTFLSSIFAWIFKDSSSLAKFTRGDLSVSFENETYRFKGLFSDPNYYSTCLILTLCLLFYLFITRNIKITSFVIQTILVLFFGFSTYSKTFLLVSLLLITIFLIPITIKQKKLGLLLTIVTISGIVLCLFLFSDIQLFITLRERFVGAEDLNELTTGRLQLWEIYFSLIISSFHSLLLGYGISADMLSLGTHNLYIEILYFSGVIGLLLMSLFFVHFLKKINVKCHDSSSSSKTTGYAICWAFLIAYFSLQGLLSHMLYVEIIIVGIGLSIPFNEIK